MCGCPLVWGQAGYRPAPNYIATGKPDQAEGALVLREFQSAGIAGTYWLGFELRVMPRQGAETKIAGQMIGTHANGGPLTRLILGGPPDTKSWLIQSGPQPALWRSDGGGGSSAARSVQGHELMEPLDAQPGTDITPFDLQMPFLYWTEFVYEGLTRIRGRPAHSFVLYPPADLTAAQPGLTGVRILLDSQFEALVQAGLLGAKGAVTKTITILDLKKMGEHWILKAIDFRNNVTRGKTRFTVTAAAFDLALPPAAFDPAALDQPLPEIPAEKIEQL